VTGIAYALATYLDSNSSTLTAGTNLWVGRMQEAPDLAVVVNEYAGDQPQFLMGPTALDSHRVEVAVRSSRDDYETGRALCEAIRALFDALPPGTYSGLSVLRVPPIDTVAALGPDRNERPRFTARFAPVVQR